MNISPKKLLIILLGILILITVSITSFFLVRKYGLLDVGRYTGYYNPREFQYKIPNLNPDKSITFYPSTFILDSFEEKKFLTDSYTVLRFRTKKGDNSYRAQTHTLLLPSKKRADGELRLYPSDLNKRLGQEVSLLLKFNNLKDKYSYSDLLSWEILE